MVADSELVPPRTAALQRLVTPSALRAMSRRIRHRVTSLVLTKARSVLAAAYARRWGQSFVPDLVVGLPSLLSRTLVRSVPMRRVDAWFRATEARRARETPDAPALPHPEAIDLSAHYARWVRRPLREVLSSGSDDGAHLVLRCLAPRYLRSWNPADLPLTRALLGNPATLLGEDPSIALPPLTVQDVRRLLAPRATRLIRHTFLSLAAAHPHVLAAVLQELPVMSATDQRDITDRLEAEIPHAGLVDLLWRAAGGDQSVRTRHTLTPTQCAWLQVLVTTPLLTGALQAVEVFDTQFMMVPDPADAEIAMALLSCPSPHLRQWALTSWLPHVPVDVLLPGVPLGADAPRPPALLPLVSLARAVAPLPTAIPPVFGHGRRR